MCYLIAKDVDAVGCIAFATKQGVSLANLKRELSEQVDETRIQLITISRPSAYVEYAPFQYIETEDEFTKAVKQL